MTTFDSVDPITGQGEKQKQLDREIRDMISALTRRLADLQGVQKPGGGGVSSHHHPEHDPELHHHRHHHPHDDDNGLRIITMAGSNVGATMRSELDVMDKTTPHDQDPNQGGSEHDQQVPLTTYLNSNFQAINNSIMLGGSYTTNDPGVHLDISDYFYTDEHQVAHLKHGKKGKKKEIIEPSKSDHHSD